MLPHQAEALQIEVARLQQERRTAAYAGVTGRPVGRGVELLPLTEESFPLELVELGQGELFETWPTTPTAPSRPTPRAAQLPGQVALF